MGTGRRVRQPGQVESRDRGPYGVHGKDSRKHRVPREEEGSGDQQEREVEVMEKLFFIAWLVVGLTLECAVESPKNMAVTVIALVVALAASVRIGREYGRVPERRD